jgi:cell division protein FtsI (penicillin-binding protein 3)
MGLSEDAVRPSERFDTSSPLSVDGVQIRDDHPLGAATDLRRAVAHSSNQVTAQIALRVGRDTQRAYLKKLGLLDGEPLEGGVSASPRTLEDGKPLTTAAIGYGYGLQTSLIAVAGAYTTFVNEGARVPPTLLRRDPDVAPRRASALSAFAASETLDLMRTVVAEGTARAADLARFDVAGKTGTAEKVRAEGGYDPDRVLASFAAIFPASAPRYVIVLALDEPQRLPENGMQITGGALAAPAVGRIVARMAPFVGLAPVVAQSERRVFASGGVSQ